MAKRVIWILISQGVTSKLIDHALPKSMCCGNKNLMPTNLRNQISPANPIEIQVNMKDLFHCYHHIPCLKWAATIHSPTHWFLQVPCNHHCLCSHIVENIGEKSTMGNSHSLCCPVGHSQTDISQRGV